MNTFTERLIARIERSQRPIDTVARAGHALSGIAHRYTTQLLDSQATLIKGALHDGAQRLQLLAKSRTPREAYARQAEYMPITRDRLARDARATWTVLGAAGREVRGVVVDTAAELRQRPVAAQAKATSATAKRRPAAKRRATGARKARKTA